MASSGSFDSPYTGLWTIWPDSIGAASQYGPACPYPPGSQQAADWQMQMQQTAWNNWAQDVAAAQQAGAVARGQPQLHGDVIDIPPEDVRVIPDTEALEGPKK